MATPNSKLDGTPVVMLIGTPNFNALLTDCSWRGCEAAGMELKDRVMPAASIGIAKDLGSKQI